MELTKINELMANRGYTKAIGAIFSNWEFVKDEILLPNRKAGSGNGTVHVYLLEDNMPLFRECFPEYVEAVEKKETDSEELCPKIKHFVLTSNILTVAGFAYHHYNCDANVFNYSDYVGKVIRHDDNGMMTFESIFKLSTENRPYFKQFDKQVFGKIIRYIFVPKKTAYKLYIYGDEEYQNFAAFWIIGQIPDKTFIVDAQYNGKPIKKEEQKVEEEPAFISEPLAITEPIVSNAHPTSTPEDVEARFIQYMKSLDKSQRTVDSYAANLRNLIPRAQKMIDGLDHPSPYTITDLNELKKLDSEVFGNTEVYEWNKKGHNRASAALHMYMSMFENDYSCDSAIEVPITETSKVNEEVHRMDFTLTPDEEAQMELYTEYLKDNKGMADVTRSSYTNTLLKRLSNLLRDYYRSDFRNVFAITDYKELLKMENEIWDIPAISDANTKSKGKLTASFRAYLDFVESSLTDEEFASLVFSDSENEQELTIIPNVGKMQQYSTYLPIYTLSAACGKFADDEDVEMEGWVNVTNYGIKASKDMFVVHAKGHSMEPRIKNGDLCVFRLYQGGSRNDDIVLTQLTSRDLDYGGMYTIKKYYSEKGSDENGVILNTKVELRSLNPECENIEITPEDAQDMKTIGVFVDTLR